MRREQQRAPRPFAPQQLPQQALAHGVYACGGLVEKDELRRDAMVKKREAAKMRLEAEKAAREAEREADEMERMATNLSQTYGMLEILESFARVP